MKMKLKTHRGAAKRFKKTATGKFKRGSAFKRHILTSKIDQAEARAAARACWSPSRMQAKLETDAAVQIAADRASGRQARERHTDTTTAY